MPETERILHVLAPAPVGGLERVVQMLSRGQAARGHKVDLAVILDAGSEETHPFPVEAAGKGVDVHVIPIPHRKYLLERRSVRELCLKAKPTVLHLHGSRIDVLHGYLGRSLGVPLLTTVHGFTGGGWKNRLYEKLQLRSMRRMDAVVAVSPKLVRQLGDFGIRKDRIHLAMNGLDEGEEILERGPAREHLDLPRDGQNVAFVGRLSHEKGADVMLEALGLLTDLPLSLSFVGDGPQEETLRARAHGLGIQDRVRWHGRVPSAGRLLGAFDAVVLSSRTEGTPIILLEAMSAEVPVVATRVGGVPDVVSDAEAILVPPESPEELAAAIRSVLGEPEKTRARVGRARERLRARFGLGPWVRRYDEIYGRAREGSAIQRP